MKHEHDIKAEEVKNLIVGAGEKGTFVTFSDIVENRQNMLEDARCSSTLTTIEGVEHETYGKTAAVQLLDSLFEAGYVVIKKPPQPNSDKVPPTPNYIL
jgi:hypothetical protein